jgi:hypothetical protein
VPEPVIGGRQVNLHAHLLGKTFAGAAMARFKQQRAEWLEKAVTFHAQHDANTIIRLAQDLYERAYSSTDLLQWLESRPESVLPSEQKYEKLIAFQKVRHEFRNERLLMMFMLHFMLFRSNDSLENISFI